MSNPKLSPKMIEALETLAATDGITYLPSFRTATLNALVDRGLVALMAISGYRLTKSGRALLHGKFTPRGEQPTAETVVAELADVMERQGLTPEQVSEDLDRLVTSDAGRAAVAARPVVTAGELYRGIAPMLYDNVESQQLFVMCFGVGAISEEVGIFYLRENDKVDRPFRFLAANRLKSNIDGRYTALCDHGHTRYNACPTCSRIDAEIHERAETAGTHLSDHIGNGASIDLGVVVFHADCTRSAITPDGDIIVRHADGDSWKTAHRAMVLEHKRNAHRLALSENEARKPAPYDIEAELLGEDRVSIEILVRTLISYGITTGAQFTAYAEKILAHDDSGTKVARPIRIDEMIAAPADVWRQRMTTPPIHSQMTMSAAEAFNVIDFSEYPVSLTSEQVIADPTGAVREWLLGSPHATPSVEHDGSNL